MYAGVKGHMSSYVKFYLHYTLVTNNLANVDPIMTKLW